MTQSLPLSRQAWFERDDVLLLVRASQPPLSPAEKPKDPPPAPLMEIFIAITASNEVIAFNGHVDLGTGIRTSLAQIVAEELDLAFEQVQMVLGDTERVPNQGATIASATIQISAIPLRKAAATARHYLLHKAAEQLQLPTSELSMDQGVIFSRHDATQRISFGQLVTGPRTELPVDDNTSLKPVEEYRIVGKSSRRSDIPAKATGGLTYVHDVRVPGMLHGRVVRPPYAGIDGGNFIGNSLLEVERDSIAHLPGIVHIEVIGDFVGIIAEREEQAMRAASELKVHWKPHPDLPDLTDLEFAVRNNPRAKQRLLLDKGNVDEAIAKAARVMPRTYVWPYQMHASIGPSCAVADVQPDRVTVWSGTQNPHLLRADLAFLLNIDEAGIEIVRYEASGCYGRNCADDVCGDAVLLSRAVGRPVRVQLTREQEHAWEPKGAAQLMDVNGGINADGSPAAYDFATSYPSNGAPMLALMLTGVVEAIPAALEMGDRTSIPPYEFDHMRVVCNDMAPIVRAAWLRGVSALPNTFAHESYIDELAHEAGVDPIEYRLRYLKDPRAVDLVKSVAQRANWEAREGSWKPKAAVGNIVKGRGFAYARYIHSKFPGFGAAWAAWVADVEVDKSTGEVSVTRVVIGHDAGLMINPDGVRHQIHGNVLQSTSRALKEQVTFNESTVTSREWGSYPILTFPEMPEIDVVMAERPEEPPQGAGESASVPSAAAIANAIFDATGVRLRQPPFTPEKVRAALYGPQQEQNRQQEAKRKKRNWLLGSLAACLTTAVGVATTLMPWRPAIAPITRPDISLYSAATLARGKQLFATGDCAVCHTAPGGIANAGGLAMETPFGTVYSTNITPDEETGIGRWSFTAFERAMREGISRDGRHLYPAFPYTSFRNMTDSDMQALYAYIMSMAPVRSSPPQTALSFPFSLRPLMAGWNSLFLKQGSYQPDPGQTDLWNRGRYLVDGLGHCTACHSPRNLLGAEKAGDAYLSGGMVDGWEAPALTALNKSPIRWSEDSLFNYLRTGHSPDHGVAAGPMAPVVAELATLPEQDVRAIAHYLATMSGATAATPAEAPSPGLSQAEQISYLQQRSEAIAASSPSAAARQFEGSCAVCHSENEGLDLFGVKPALAVNTNVHSDSPDNLIRIILNGIPKPANPELGYMPAFANSMNDQQISGLVNYIRQTFASDKAAWSNVSERVAFLRANPGSH
ncbi:aldehyde dehydrogenase [Pokkaliibacter plantistimulans]|uniref:Aldehyde dehydrogenase n=1 Tax=Proteobacteria bacterium 228 TaxID=2083153 RepID=A0A2S5KVK9_9PROT|nr:molybdopterin cofactor-binding domain-containing protein [Pokkaliibacter plantistimulans]PPC78800.1 aldehyde dehydrogenase [Pokkaliibacter plantistimulans]